MSLSAKIREQLISSFRAELAEHVQTLNDGLLAIEQGKVAGEHRAETLENIFRAAHSLKGAARAVGVSAVEQLAHALEDVLSALQQSGATEPPTELFNACYRAVDAIQLVEEVYESGGDTPPPQVLKALTDLEPYRHATSDQQSMTTKVRPQITDQPSLTTEASDAQPLAGNVQPATSNVQPPIPNPQSPIPTTNHQADETIRVSVSKLDALMAQLSELLVTKIRAEQRMAQVRQAQEYMAAWQKEWLSIRSGYSRLARQVRELTAIVSVDMETASMHRASGPHGRQLASRRAVLGDGRLDKEMARLLSYVDASQERLREVNGLMNNLSREYANDTMHMALVIDELEQEIKRVRMLPLSTITGPFMRMVRDMAQSAGKEAVLEINGAEVELDKRVLEQIKDPLIHLLRNAIDHGLERPERRQTAGKPRAGSIRLTAEQVGKDVIMAVSDDGSGLDIAGIRQTAMRRGIIEAQTLSDTELVELIFNAGFSTSPIITDVSGRGVGLDVVRRNVEALHGRVNVDWTPNAGTTFRLTLPLALTSSRGLMVRVSNQLFAIPLNSIERIEYVRPDQVASLGGHDTLRYDGRPLTLVRLNDVLGLPRANGNGAHHENGRMPVVILTAAEKRMAFAVEELAGEQEVVVKGLGRQLSRVGGISGATVMGSGEVILILNVADLLKLAQRADFHSRMTGPEAESQEPQAKATDQKSSRFILVVDDSITTRTLEKNILEAAGYTVQLATDGQEALNAIAAGDMPDLIVSDIAMPRLDGFSLTQHIKSDTRTANVPVILVTSLDSPEDKAHGIEVGADAYIVKSGFDQNNLLGTIEQLI